MAAAGAYIAVQRARRQRDEELTTTQPPRAPVSATTRTARRMTLARMGARAGGGYALHRAQRVFSSAERRDELDARFELRTAEQVAETLGQMKGALMKIGQMASYLDTGMPEHVRQALAELQHAAPPMSGDLAATVVEQALGARPDEVFAEWDPVPIAAASIGQVHRAITRDDRAVAVKVQYPGVDEAIRSDLDNAGQLMAAIGLMFPGLEPGPIVEELRARIGEELDYRQEAANQRLFADYYADHPFIHIPAVVDELSAERVLTTELGEGVRFAEAVTWSEGERNRAAEAIYRFVFRSLYRLHAFNGDPHPGNYLFRPGGRVTFLDFGLVKRFTPEEIRLLAELAKTIVIERDLAAYRRAVERAGFTKDTSPFSDELVQGYYGHFYEFVMEDAPHTISSEWSSESLRRFFDTAGPYGEIIKASNLPPSFVIIQRINLGLFAVLGDLNATANWRRIAEEIWPFVEGPPSTPMGEAEAEWHAHTGH